MSKERPTVAESVGMRVTFDAIGDVTRGAAEVIESFRRERDEALDRCSVLESECNIANAQRDEAREAAGKWQAAHFNEGLQHGDTLAQLAEARALVGRLADALRTIANGPCEACGILLAECGRCADVRELVEQATRGIPPSLRRPAGEPV